MIKVILKKLYYNRGLIYSFLNILQTGYSIIFSQLIKKSYLPIRLIPFPPEGPYYSKAERKIINEYFSSHILLRKEQYYLDAFNEIMRAELNVSGFFGVDSGSSALFDAFQIIGANKNTEIIIPIYGFNSDFTAPLLTGAKIKYAKVDKFGNIIPSELKNLLTDKTIAVLIVHSDISFPADIITIRKIVKQKNKDIFLIEDTSCGFGSKIHGKYTGCFGDIGITSFGQFKTITTGGKGGALIINNPKLLKKANKYYSSWDINHKMDELRAAVGVEQAKKFRIICQKRKRNLKILYNGLYNQCFFIIPKLNTEDLPVLNYYYFGIKNNKKEITKRLNKRKVFTTSANLFVLKTYKSFISNFKSNIDDLNSLHKKLIGIRVDPWLNESDMNDIVKIIMESADVKC